MSNKGKNKTSKQRASVLLIILSIISFAAFCSCNEEKKTDQHQLIQTVQPVQPVQPVQQENKYDKYEWGIDISYYQENIPMEEFFSRLKDAECGFCYIQIGKSTENGQMMDSREVAFEMAEYAEKYGIPFGFYYFTSGKTPEEMLADLGLFTLTLADAQSRGWRYNVFPPMVDHEVIPDDSHVESKLEQLTAMVQSMNLMGYNDILVYTSASRLDLIRKALQGTNSHIWLASYDEVQGTGVRPEENPALIPDFLTHNDEVVCWQYASDRTLFGERFNELTLEFISSVGKIDRDLMSEEYYQICVDKIEEPLTTKVKDSK